MAGKVLVEQAVVPTVQKRWKMRWMRVTWLRFLDLNDVNPELGYNMLLDISTSTKLSDNRLVLFKFIYSNQLGPLYATRVMFSHKSTGSYMSKHRGYWIPHITNNVGSSYCAHQSKGRASDFRLTLYAKIGRP
ncbi:hypothetical protein FRC02_011328 [Tulasnella sp. 418]|nr:hypothetical protein FRC02_011328 [Tulasnella sp. 418]